MKTPNEKAKDLMNKFISYADDSMASSTDNARNCALLCVNETIASLRTWENTYMGREQILYFLKVKDELETF